MKKTNTSDFKTLFVICLLLSVNQAVVNAQTIISSANVALNKTATASSFQTDKYVKNAFDGNVATRYSSLYSDNEFISVDLGQMYLVSQVVLVWERAYGKDFDILFSRDGSFTDLNNYGIQIRGNSLGTDSIAGTNTIKMQGNTIARYVRMQGVHRATEFGYSLFEFQVAGSVSVSDLLPVTLTGFTVSEQNNTNIVEWTTTTENNAAGFSIERSNDGTNFTSIGWVNSINGGTVVNHYSYTDKQAGSGKSYYRLKVSDLNGKTGSTAAISISAVSNMGLKTYPIPVKDHLSIEYKGTPGETVNISLYNTCGQPVYTSKQAIRGSQQTMNITRTSNMLPGIYTLTIGAPGSTQYSEQIVLQ
ncbi:MAG: discoidin domain-containing protein [Bacteroidota bacterium]